MIKINGKSCQTAKKATNVALYQMFVSPKIRALPAIIRE